MGTQRLGDMNLPKVICSRARSRTVRVPSASQSPTSTVTAFHADAHTCCLNVMCHGNAFHRIWVERLVPSNSPFSI